MKPYGASCATLDKLPKALVASAVGFAAFCTELEKLVTELVA